MPALLATAAVFIPARSAKGVACKSVTIGLLISLIFLGEGVMCVLMTAPLFYLVALFVGAMIDMSRRHDKGHSILSILDADVADADEPRRRGADHDDREKHGGV